ncbi:oleosin 16 kDa [Cucurbita maxima]|uniref:Oleosin 16 kDa n=1 Tax=Cucurbita maxima TaxID=3661 RepID=A0A6J1JA16_CUCMA|nr:oleosin 16 kDa [Cucurbita maxima]
MADNRTPTGAAAASTLLRRFQDHTPHSPHLLGFLTLFITASILMFLTGVTLTAGILALIFLTPFIIFTSPIWVPLAFLLFATTTGVLSLGGIALVSAAGFSWAYRYFKGMHPPGSEGLEYARSRIYDTASHVKDYAREYGGYLQSKVKDAAPGA